MRRIGVAILFLCCILSGLSGYGEQIGGRRIQTRADMDRYEKWWGIYVKAVVTQSNLTAVLIEIAKDGDKSEYVTYAIRSGGAKVIPGCEDIDQLDPVAQLVLLRTSCLIWVSSMEWIQTVSEEALKDYIDEFHLYESKYDDKTACIQEYFNRESKKRVAKECKKEGIEEEDND